jgi:hypothetical protein
VKKWDCSKAVNVGFESARSSLLPTRLEPPNRRHGTKAHDPAACPNPTYQRIVNESQSNTSVTIAAVQDGVKISCPSGLDGDLAGPFLLKNVKVLRGSKRPGCRGSLADFKSSFCD